MGITADRLSRLGLVDEVIREPLGGAHRDSNVTAESLKAALLRHLKELDGVPIEKIIETRSARLQSFGVFSEA
jgi:acetyl-CoA carboxylase carboxyl transferase subunit alpha